MAGGHRETESHGPFCRGFPFWLERLNLHVEGGLDLDTFEFPKVTQSSNSKINIYINQTVFFWLCRGAVAAT